ncbi:MAG: cytochrome c3 family protein [Rhodospirillales bacterium]
MKDPSPRAHLVRLGLIMAAGVVVFLVLKSVLVPASWVDEGGDWYRGESLNEMMEQPLIYGGNESCQVCHSDVIEEMDEFKHKTLSCESCHGALIDHVQDEQKIADAFVDDESTWQCLNCHDERITKPEGFPQWNKQKAVEHMQMEEGMLCITCHTPHDPTP